MVLGNQRVMLQGALIMFFTTIFISGTIGFIRSIGHGGYIIDLFYDQVHTVCTIFALCYFIVCISAFAVLGGWLFQKVKDVWAVCLAIVLTGILMITLGNLLIEMISWLAEYLKPGINDIKPFTNWYSLQGDYDFIASFAYGTVIGLIYIALRVSKKSEHRIAKIAMWLIVIGVLILPIKQLYEEYLNRETVSVYHSR